jgi:hypothetical protein
MAATVSGRFVLQYLFVDPKVVKLVVYSRAHNQKLPTCAAPLFGRRALLESSCLIRWSPIAVIRTCLIFCSAAPSHFIFALCFLFIHNPRLITLIASSSAIVIEISFSVGFVDSAVWTSLYRKVWNRSDNRSKSWEASSLNKQSFIHTSIVFVYPALHLLEQYFPQ